MPSRAYQNGVVASAGAAANENACAAVSAVLNEAVVYGAMVRLAVALPKIGFFTPNFLASGRLADYISERGRVKRASHLPRQFFIAVTEEHVLAATLRFGSRVSVRKILAKWPRSTVSAHPSDSSPLWIDLRLEDLTVSVEPTDRSAVAALLEVLDTRAG